MFGVPISINILNKINSFRSRDKNRNKYRVIITPPYTLLESFAKYFRNKKIMIGSQNCYQKDQFSSNTAAVSPYMIRSVGAKYTLIGHSDNRAEGDTDSMLKDKVRFALKNNLKVIFCIGEKLEEIKNRSAVLKKQLTSLPSKFLSKNIIIAYEPVWAIGTGKTPTVNEINNIHISIRKMLHRKVGKEALSISILYGGSVNSNNSQEILNLSDVDGALVGGASLKSKEFCKIIDSSN